MPYKLRNTKDQFGKISKLLGEKVLYEVPLEDKVEFEKYLKWNELKIEVDSTNDEAVTYVLSHLNFIFTDAEVIEFDPYLTFGRAIQEIEIAIEENGPRTAIEFSTHPKYKEKFEQYLSGHNYEFEFLEEDDNRAVYLLSRKQFPFKGAK